MSGEPCALLVGGSATSERGLVAASRVANATGAKLLGETFPARLERGAGRPPLERLGYLAEFMTAQLAGLRHLVLVDAKAPVSFFAYPEKPSYLVPDGCEVHVLAGRRRRRGRRARAPRRRRRRRRSPRSNRRSARSGRPASSRVRRSRTPSARCSPRARSSPTRRTRRACGSRRLPPARHRTTG